MIPTAQGLLLNQVIITIYLFHVLIISVICMFIIIYIHEKIYICIHIHMYIHHSILYEIFYALYLLYNCLYMYFYYHKKLLHVSFICHISNVGITINWTCYCTATTRRRSTHTKDASKRATTNTYCTGDGFIHTCIFIIIIIAY